MAASAGRVVYVSRASCVCHLQRRRAEYGSCGFEPGASTRKLRCENVDCGSKCLCTVRHDRRSRRSRCRRRSSLKKRHSKTNRRAHHPRIFHCTHPHRGAVHRGRDRVATSARWAARVALHLAEAGSRPGAGTCAAWTRCRRHVDYSKLQKSKCCCTPSQVAWAAGAARSAGSAAVAAAATAGMAAAAAPYKAPNSTACSTLLGCCIHCNTCTRIRLVRTWRTEYCDSCTAKTCRHSAAVVAMARGRPADWQAWVHACGSIRRM